jgi:hypothetical protein
LTLVELAVASVLLGLTVSMVTVMVGNSNALRSATDHYRQARIIAQEELEDPERHFLNYAVIADFDADLELDYHETGKPSLRAHRDVSVGDSTREVLGGAVTIPNKMVNSTVSWTEGGKSLSVTLRKRVVDVK